jgi:protein-tyrosine-phosphatase
LEQLNRLYLQAGESLHPGLVPSGQFSADLTEGPTIPLRVLFLCTHNSARSQLAEAILRYMGEGHEEQVEVYSAGSRPTEVRPNTLTVLRDLGIDTSKLYAKSLDQFLGESFDYIITVCDRVRDICPVFPGDPLQVHWSFPDPDVIEDPERQLAAFRRTATELQTRVRYLLLLPHPRTGRRLRTLES